MKQDISSQSKQRALAAKRLAAQYALIRRQGVLSLSLLFLGLVVWSKSVGVITEYLGLMLEQAGNQQNPWLLCDFNFFIAFGVLIGVSVGLYLNACAFCKLNMQAYALANEND